MADKLSGGRLRGHGLGVHGGHHLGLLLPRPPNLLGTRQASHQDADLLLVGGLHHSSESESGGPGDRLQHVSPLFALIFVTFIIANNHQFIAIIVCLDYQP